ncbi:MAG: VOC family protein [Myxococcota bacterium]
MVPPPGEDEVADQAAHDRRVDYVEFAVTDVEGAKRFYGSVFGWEFIDYGPDYASFYDGRLAGGFRLEPEVTSGGPLVVLYAVDLGEVEALVRDAGGKIVREIFEFPGGRRFHFTDPSGNELAVWSDR